MSKTAEKIQQIEGLRRYGNTVSEAIVKALGCPMSEFAGRHGWRHTEVSMCLNGYHQRTYPEIRDAICAELEIPREYIDQLIDSQRPSEAANDPAA